MLAFTFKQALVFSGFIFQNAAAFGCFSSGATLGEIPPAAYIEEACRTLDYSAYDAHTYKTYCISLDIGYKARVDFKIANTFNYQQSLDYQHCLSNMLATAKGCAYGGIRATGLFEATFDPNVGIC